MWNPALNDAFELSSMGIRVDAEALQRQLTLTGDVDRLSLEQHQVLMRGDMPQTIGGGIGQSRLVMLLLAHIGQVQCSAVQCVATARQRSRACIAVITVEALRSGVAQSPQ